MRKILFRGKVIEACQYLGQWIEGFYGADDGKPFIGIQQTNGLNGFFCDPQTVGQYTGLTDKNGKKVFEHDIVKAYDPLDEISFVGVVKYFDGSFYICDTVFCSHYRWLYYEVEVIGNIYDNRELIGGVKMINKMTTHVKNEIISVIADSLGKQIPLKPRLEKRAGLCAACNSVITRSWKYCPCCGQCIAWNKKYSDEG